MRRAVLARCAPEETQRRFLHAAISDYLESLPASDPLIRVERMAQLIGERNATRAGTHYAEVNTYEESTTERLGSTWTLVEWIAQAERGAQASSVPHAASLVLHSPQGDEGRGSDLDTETPDNPHLVWITSWLADHTLSHDQIYRLTCNFQFGLFKRMENDVDLPARHRLVEATRSALHRLAAADPSNPGWQYDLSISRNSIGDVLLAQGDLAGALSEFLEALALADRLAVADPSNAVWQHAISVCHDRIGGVLRAQGDLAGALREFRKALALAERLAAADPSNAEWQHDISISHDRIGRILRAQGDLAGALGEFREFLAVAERLAAADPSNAGCQRVLSVSRDNIGDLLLDQGDCAGALEEFRESLSVAERLAAADLSNAGWQHDLGISYERMGSVLQSQGDLAGALAAFQKKQEIIERLAAVDPSNTDWQHDISISQNHIGEVLRAQGDLAGALREFRKSLAVAELLTAADPSNAGWQRNISVSRSNIGEVLRAQGDPAGALGEFRESLALSERLSAAEPTNAEWQRALVAIYWRMADMAEKDSTGEAREWWHKAYAQLFAMKQRGIMLPTDETHLATLLVKAEGREPTILPAIFTRQKLWMRRFAFGLVWLLIMALMIWLPTVSSWFWILSGPLLLLGIITLLFLIPSMTKRLNAWVAEQQKANQ